MHNFMPFCSSVSDVFKLKIPKRKSALQMPMTQLIGKAKCGTLC